MLPKLRCEKLQELDTARAGHTATLVGSKIFVFGGRNGALYLNDLWMFDTETEEWKQLQEHAPFPGRAYHSATLVREREIWIIGGSCAKQLFSDVHVLKTDVLEWHSPVLNNQGVARGTHAAVLHPLKQSWILIYGGYGGTSGTTPTWLDDLCVLDTDALTWNQLHPKGCAPAARGYHSFTALGNKVVLFGGKNTGTLQEDNASLYDPVDDKWFTLEALGEKPTPRCNHAAARLKDSFIVIHGGRQGAVRLNDFFLLQVSSCGQVFRWHKYLYEKAKTPGRRPKVANLVDSLEGRAAHCMIAWKESLYIFAGYGGEKRTFSDVYVVRQFPYPGSSVPPKKSLKSSLLVDATGDNEGWLTTKRRREEHESSCRENAGAPDTYEWISDGITTKKLQFMEQASAKKCTTVPRTPVHQTTYAQLETLQRQKSSLEHDLQNVKEELQVVRCERDSLQENLRQTQEQAEAGDIKISALLAQVDSLRADLCKAHTERETVLVLKDKEKQDHVRVLEQKMESSIERWKSMYEDAVLERDEYKSCIQKLEVELQKQMQALQHVKANSEAERNILLQEVAERKETADRIFTELGMSKESTRVLQENAQRLTKQLEQANMKMDQYQKEKEELNRVSGGLSAELKQAIAAKTTADSSLQLARMELQSTRTLLDQNTVELRKMKDRAEEDAAHINTWRSSLKKTQEQLNSLLEENERLRNLLREAEEFEKTQLRLLQVHVDKMQSSRQLQRSYSVL